MTMATKAALFASALLLTAAPAAFADHPYNHRGGCGFAAVSDGTDSPSTRWDGAVHAVVVATDNWTYAPTGEQLTVECVMEINGAPGTVVLSESGIGAVAKVVPLTYYGDPDDVLSMCTRVTIRNEVKVDCGGGPATPLLPPAVLEQLDAAIALVNTLLDPLVDTLDSTMCPALLAMDGGPADQPPVDIRSDGDVYLAGEWIVDCSPYTTGT